MKKLIKKTLNWGQECPQNLQTGKSALHVLLPTILALSMVRAHAGIGDSSVSPRIYTLTNGVTINNQTVSANVSTNLFPTFGYMHDMSVFTTVISANNVFTGSETNYFDLTLDGTNYTTAQPLQTVTAINGPTNISCTVISKSSLEGCQAIRLTKIGISNLGSGTNATVQVQFGVTP
jgi:hypothetical protein